MAERARTKRRRTRSADRPERGHARRKPGPFVVGARPVAEALRAGRREMHRLVWLRRAAGPRPAIAEILDLADRLGVASEGLAGDEFETLLGSGSPPHQGVALEAGPIPTLTLRDLPRVLGEARLLVALDGVEDPHNLGAIARVAVAAGAEGLVLPKRRSAPLSSAASRASAGALEHLPTAVVPNLREALTRLQKLGFVAIGADPTGEVSLYDQVFDPHGEEGADRPRILVLGGEGGGIRPALRGSLDFRLQIPMTATIGSLNVSTAAAVILFEWRRSGWLSQRESSAGRA